MFGWLNRFGPTFDQLLAKYMEKKVVPHDRPIKQTKSKRRFEQKPMSTKLTQKVVQPRSPGHPPLGMAWCFPIYPSPMCCPTQVWGGTAMSPYCWLNLFAYSGSGHHMMVRQTWPKRMQSETAFVHQSSMNYLYYLITRVDDLHRDESLLREQNNS